MMADNLVNRTAAAKANVERDLQTEGLHWTVEVQRVDGYTLTLKKGTRTFTRKGLDEAVLEDVWSTSRASLLREARRELEDV